MSSSAALRVGLFLSLFTEADWEGLSRLPKVPETCQLETELVTGKKVASNSDSQAPSPVCFLSTWPLPENVISREGGIRFPFPTRALI